MNDEHRIAIETVSDVKNREYKINGKLEQPGISFELISILLLVFVPIPFPDSLILNLTSFTFHVFCVQHQTSIIYFRMFYDNMSKCLNRFLSNCPVD